MKRVRPDLAALEVMVNEHFNEIREGKVQPEKIKRKMIEAILNNAIDLTKSLRIAKEMMEHVERGYAEAGYVVGHLDVVLTSEGLVGMGHGPFKAAFEVGLNVDPVLGLPYYPGSGIKGAVRNFLWTMADEEYINKVFGSSSAEEGEVSKVIFSDAFPIGCKRECSVFKPLVVTPHYFRGGEVVKNELEAEPTPVVHVGISENMVFRLVIAIRKDSSKEVNELFERLKGDDEEVKKVISNVKGLWGKSEHKTALLRVVWVTLYVLSRGIAARSSKGYNVFEPFSGELKFDIVGYKFTA